MKNTVLVELKNENALNLLYDLEKMDILHVVKDGTNVKYENSEILINPLNNEIPEKIKLSDKLKGLLTKEQGLDLKRHVKSIRQEWTDL